MSQLRKEKVIQNQGHREEPGRGRDEDVGSTAAYDCIVVQEKDEIRAQEHRWKRYLCSSYKFIR